MFKPRLWIIVATVVGTLWGGSAASTTAVASVDPTTCDLPRGTAEGPPARGAAVHAVGTVKAVMLFVDFPDATTTDDFTPYVDQLKPSEAWFATSSYGRLKLQVTTVKQWFRMPSNASDYDFTRGLTFDEHKRYLSDAIAAADSTVDFSQYKIVYVVAADNATAITYSPAFIGGAAGVEVDGTTIGFGATFGQDMWYFGSRILNHETGHVFGLPDLYDYDPVDFATDHRFVGFWDLMGWILGDAPDFMAWHKWHLGWIDSTQVVCQRARGHRTVVLSPVEERGGKKLALIRISSNLVYAVEVRARQGNDADVCKPGVLVYRVRGDIATGQGPLQVRTKHADNPWKLDACGPKYNATLQVGQTYSDALVRVTVNGRSDGKTTVTIKRK